MSWQYFYVNQVFSKLGTRETKGRERKIFKKKTLELSLYFMQILFILSPETIGTNNKHIRVCYIAT